MHSVERLFGYLRKKYDRICRDALIFYDSQQAGERISVSRISGRKGNVCEQEK